jgi:hypothetical protein
VRREAVYRDAGPDKRRSRSCRPLLHRLSPPITAHPCYRHLGEEVEGNKRNCGKSLIISVWHEDAKEAFGHGVRAKRSKSGAVSFEVIEEEVGHASVE